MSAPVEFYFDFASPYAYFASRRIDELVAPFGRPVRWRPILLGPAFAASRNARLIDQPLKGAYARHDWERVSRLTGIPYRFPEPFPVATLAPARVYWWLEAEAPALARRFAHAVFAAYFAEGRNIAEREVTADLAEGLGIGRSDALAAIEDPRWKAKLRQETEDAVARGVFGAPFVVVDGEAFWGWDRLDMVREWLTRGGW
ncbi:MAG: 2-hydroxychromene-2-carboxylate isomerase [Solirubrobacterales bacterium]